MNEFVGKKSDFIASILKTKIKLKIQANKSVGALILDYHIILLLLLFFLFKKMEPIVEHNLRNYNGWSSNVRSFGHF